MLYSGFNILPRSVVRSAYSIDRSDNLDVIPLKKMLKKRLLAPAVFFLLLICWCFTLGLHSTHLVRTHCDSTTFGEQLDVHVFLIAQSSTSGLPYIFTHSTDNVPYSLELAVTVDESIDHESVEISNFSIVFSGGSTFDLMENRSPIEIEFQNFQAYPHDVKPGKSYRRASYDFPDCVPVSYTHLTLPTKA